jgi:hypothetical protein
MTPILRSAIVVVAISVTASACGSGGAAGHASGHLALQAGVRRGACLPVHPVLSPYRGSLILIRSDGRRVRVVANSRGHGRMPIAPGRYRLVPPFPGSTVHLEVDGRAVAVINHRYPLRIIAGKTARVALVILRRRGECTSSGAGA